MQLAYAAPGSGEVISTDAGRRSVSALFSLQISRGVGHFAWCRRSKNGFVWLIRNNEHKLLLLCERLLEPFLFVHPETKIKHEKSRLLSLMCFDSYRYCLEMNPLQYCTRRNHHGKHFFFALEKMLHIFINRHLLYVIGWSW